jgi:hypothetical protein|tara:strand:+ start:203 stop:643 length:441 start_codon:yes stop_codon:yes gene_type:complete
MDALDKTLIDKRNPNTKLWQTVPDWAMKVYVFLFTKGKEKFLKVGVTSYMEAYDRILFNHAIFHEGGEKDWVTTTMVDHFDTVSIQTSAMLPKDKAKALESTILKTWGDQDLDLPKIKGMSEFREYNYERLRQARDIIQENRFKRR